MKHHQKQIALLQLDTQEAALKKAKHEIEMGPAADTNEAFRMKDHLNIEIRAIQEVRLKLRDQYAEPEKWYSNILLRLYRWSTGARFDLR